MKRHYKIYQMAILACFMALIAILTFVPYIGYIPLGFTSVTIIHIVVIIGAILLGKNNGAILGLFMGITSLIKASSGTSGDMTFIMPWVSILPRIAFGYLTGLFYELFLKIKLEYFRNILTSIISTILHTLMVFICYLPTFVFMYGDGDFLLDFSGQIGVNVVNAPLIVYCFASFMFSCLFEAIFAALIAPVVIKVLDKTTVIKKFKLKQSKVKEKNNENI